MPASMPAQRAFTGLVRACEEVIWQIARVTRLYRLDLFLWARKARQLDAIAGACAESGSASAERFYREAARNHRAAIVSMLRRAGGR